MKEKKFIHILHELPATRRLLISVAFAAIIFLIIQKQAASVQFMCVWIGFALSNLLLFWITITTAKPDEIKRIAKKQDNSRTLIFLVVIAASFISLLAIILLLQILPTAKGASYYYHVSLSVASVICSWLLIHTIFTFRYTHLFYSCKTKEKEMDKEHMGGLDFPNDDEPDYMDFAYFAFVVGMTFQVSDVQVTSSNIRRLVLLHGLLSFAYNTVIVALSINIISGLIQK